MFAQSVSPQQANALYCLGPKYQSHFKHDAEIHNLGFAPKNASFTVCLNFDEYNV
jgi:hypothetical protein